MDDTGLPVSAPMAVEDILASLGDSLERHGLDVLDSGRTGDLASPRVQDVAAALGRLRSLRLRRHAPRGASSIRTRVHDPATLP